MAYVEISNILITKLLNRIYPIGTIYTTSLSTSAATILQFGTWERFTTNGFLAPKSSSNAGYSTEGVANTPLMTHTHANSYLTHTHSVPAGTGTLSGSGGGHAHQLAGSNGYYLGLSADNKALNKTARAYTSNSSSTNYGLGITPDSNAAIATTTTIGGTGHTTVHSTTTTSGSFTQTSQTNTYSDEIDTNFPPYLSVAFWKRIA